MGDTSYTAGPFNADLSSLFAPAGNQSVSVTPKLEDFIQPSNQALQQIPEEIVQQLDTSTSDGLGGDPSFDPSRAANTASFDEMMVGFEPGAGKRAQDSLLDSSVEAIKGNAAKMALMGQLGAQVNPADLLNPTSLLTAAPKAMMTAAGVETPDNAWGGLFESLPAGLASFAGLNPVVGTAAGLLGPVVADAAGDFFGFRDNDDLRDQLEDVSGQLRGRRQYRTVMDDMDNYGVGNNQDVLDNVGSWGEAADIAGQNLSTWEGRSQPNIDDVLRQATRANTYNMLQSLIDQGSGNPYEQGTDEAIDYDLESFFDEVDDPQDRDGGGNGFGGGDGTVNDNSGSVGGWGGGVTL